MLLRQQINAESDGEECRRPGGCDDFAILEPEEFEANQRGKDGGRNKRRNHHKYCASSKNVEILINDNVIKFISVSSIY